MTVEDCIKRSKDITTSSGKGVSGGLVIKAAQVAINVAQVAIKVAQALFKLAHGWLKLAQCCSAQAAETSLTLHHCVTHSQK
jgi:hypothetical protein